LNIVSSFSSVPRAVLTHFKIGGPAAFSMLENERSDWLSEEPPRSDGFFTFDGKLH
jgi:hypothetical protein